MFFLPQRKAWEREEVKINHQLTSRKIAELALRQKFVRREPGKDGKILRDRRQHGNDEVHRLQVKRKNNYIYIYIGISCGTQKYLP